MHADSTAILNRLFARESCALLQFLGECYPWTAVNGSAPLDRLRTIIDEERDSLTHIAEEIVRRRVPLQSGAYPERYMDMHFVALDHLLPPLVAYQKVAVVELERDLAAVGSDEARGLVEKHLEMKRRHLETLQALAGTYAGKHAVSTLR